jgi:hypothetical protein
MSYTLRLTDGKILLTLADQQLDSVSTSLTLIGKNVNAYGDDINTNFIHLLENFANTTPPTSPLSGQLWFNTNEQRMYFYNNSLQFKPVGGPVVSASEPVGLVSGDLWIDTTAKQLKFYDGSNLITAGPGYNATLGKSGVLTETVLDSSFTNRTVSNIYSNGSLIGIISDSQFTLNTSLSTSTGISTVNNGINLAVGTKFYGTATNAESLNGVNAADILVSTITTPQSISSTLNVYNDDGISVGDFDDLQLFVVSPNRVATIAVGDSQDFNLLLQTPTNPNINALYFKAATGQLGIFTNNPTAPVDINSNVRIRGNLLVSGTATYVDVVDLRVADKTIELASTSTSDVLSSGGGIVLKGTTDKTLLWTQGFNAWVSSESINLQAGKTFQIGGNTVLSGTSLGTVVTAAPGLKTIGNLTSATIGLVNINSSTISTRVSTTLTIAGGLTTEVDFSGKKLFNAYTPVTGDEGHIVATKSYVDSAVSVARGGQYAFTIDVTGNATSPEDPNLDNFVISYLEMVLPPGEPSPYGVTDNSRARIIVTRYQTTSSTVVSNPLNFAPVDVYEAGTTSTISAVGYQTNYVATVPIPALSLLVNRAVKQYIVSAQTWVRYVVTGTSNTVYTDGTW